MDTVQMPRTKPDIVAGMQQPIGYLTKLSNYAEKMHPTVFVCRCNELPSPWSGVVPSRRHLRWTGTIYSARRWPEAVWHRISNCRGACGGPEAM